MMDEPNRAQLAKARAGRREIKAAEALPAWASNPELLTLVLRDPAKLRAGLAAMRAIVADSSTPKAERLVIENLIRDIEALAARNSGV